MRRPPPRSTLFPYTTLFRSAADADRPSVFRAGAVSYLRIPAEDPQAAAEFYAEVFGWSIRTDRAEPARSEEHTSELQSRENLVCRLLLEKKKTTTDFTIDNV